MKYFIISVVVLLILLFWAPWITAHIEEDYLESPHIREISQDGLCSYFQMQISSEHDGVGVAWAPFGREIIGCEEEIYIPFWKFQFNPTHFI